MDKIKFKTQIVGKDMGIFNIMVMYKKISGIFTLIMGLVAFAMAVMSFMEKAYMNAGVFILIGLLFLIYFPYILLKRGNRQVANNPTFQKPLFYTLDSNGVYIDQGPEHAKLAWEDLYKASENKWAIYLYTAPKAAFVWPKNQIGEDAKYIKEIIKNNMAPTKCKSIKVK